MIPLAERLRPKTIEEFIGQKHLLGKGRAIRVMLDKKEIKSMILWGPPGSGKTTLARLIAKYVNADFIQVSAVEDKISEVKKLFGQAKENKQLYGKETIIFVDEIHRFNKAQQDAFLPFVENGTITLIGATTENPGFEVISPLLSRSQLFILNALEDDEIKEILDIAVKNLFNVKIDEDSKDLLVAYANGDARRALNALEGAINISNKVTKKTIKDALQSKFINYDKKGDEHYDTISAFIKSMRGSDPDATLHYLARMLKGGEDPIFIARRMVVFASEDIGNAMPTALVIATSCMQAVHMIGMPEAQLILAQTATYLASCKKSIASTVGIGMALNDIENMKIDPIPIHLRNPKNKAMKKIGYGKDHIRYTWLEEKKTGKKINQKYLPKNLEGKKYYTKDWE